MRGAAPRVARPAHELRTHLYCNVARQLARDVPALRNLAHAYWEFARGGPLPLGPRHAATGGDLPLQSGVPLLHRPQRYRDRAVLTFTRHVPEDAGTLSESLLSATVRAGRAAPSRRSALRDARIAERARFFSVVTNGVLADEGASGELLLREPTRSSSPLT